MQFSLVLAVITLAASVPALAESHAAAEADAEMVTIETTGDAVAGEKAFRKCVSCHVVMDEAGELLAGKKARTGPNLYGVAGGMFGQVADYKYSRDAVTAGGLDILLDEATFVEYVQDPKAWLRKVTENAKARSKMSYKVKKPEEAADLFAYLLSLK